MSGGDQHGTGRWVFTTGLVEGQAREVGAFTTSWYQATAHSEIGIAFRVGAQGLGGRRCPAHLGQTPDSKFAKQHQRPACRDP